MTRARTPSRRGRPTAEDAHRKLAQVITVASEQFSALGYRAVTMRGVAEKAQVSTRTLYDRYADKLSLFVACLDFGAAVFPQLNAPPKADLHHVLQEHAAAIVRALSKESSLRLGLLVYREGGDFPELVRAAEANQDRYLVQPLADYFRGVGLASQGAQEVAKVFIIMALSEWQRSVTFRRPLLTGEDIDRHAAFIVSLFLNGVKAATSRLTNGSKPADGDPDSLPTALRRRRPRA
jgi:TetR/AcrR family transcriptional repressor of mexJK operon